MKALPEKSLNVFCEIFDFSRGQPDITSPATHYRVSCLNALERRGLIQWDSERVRGKNKRWAALTEVGARYGCEGLALVAEAQDPKRNRVWLKVQFDLNNEDYQKAYDLVGELARKRKLAPTIRDLLLHGIPDTKETRQFETMMQAFQGLSQMQETLQVQLAEVLEENKKLRLENAELRRSQGANLPPVSDLPRDNRGTQTSGGLKAIGGLKPIAAPNPEFDDDEDEGLLEIRKDEKSGMNATMNFLASMKALSEAKSTGESTLTPRQKARLEKDARNE